jgi:hypothetical protein
MLHVLSEFPLVACFTRNGQPAVAMLQTIFELTFVFNAIAPNFLALPLDLAFDESSCVCLVFIMEKVSTLSLESIFNKITSVVAAVSEFILSLTILLALNIITSVAYAS